MRMRRVALLASVVLLGLAGCTGTLTSSAGSDTASEPEDASADAPAPEKRSSLQPYLDVLFDSVTDEEFVAEKVEIEESVAVCMADRGFPYTPKPLDYYEKEQESDPTNDPDSREWIAVHGYGTYPTRQEVADLATRQANAEEADPNTSYVDSLSESQRLAYDTALYGFTGDDGQPVGAPGCAAALIGAADGAPSLADRNQPLVDAVNRLFQETIPRTSEYLRAQNEWATCMSASGYPELTDFDAIGRLHEQAVAAAMQLDTTAPDYQQQVAPARAEEVEIALSDFDCRMETGFDDGYSTLTFRMEEEFVAQNRAELDAMMAEAEQSGR